MNIHLSEEAARFIASQLDKSGCRSASEFIERLLREIRSAETSVEAEKNDWLRAQETAAAKLWDNDDDARYDAL